MRTTFLPRPDAALLAWANNFLAVAQIAPTTYGLTAAQCTAFGGLATAYSTTLAACEPGIRNKAAVVAKNQARFNLEHSARLLASIVEGQATVTNAQKIELGLNVRAQPTPIPAPSSVPGIAVTKVSGWVASVRLYDIASSAQRGKPPGVSGVSVFSHVGPTPPTDITGWTFQGNAGRTKFDVTFPSTLAAGTTVWLTAFWFNGRKQSGPAAPPISANLPGGTVMNLAA